MYRAVVLFTMLAFTRNMVDPALRQRIWGPLLFETMESLEVGLVSLSMVAPTIYDEGPGGEGTNWDP